MQATGWIAIYAAAVSTGSLGWQILSARQTKRPQVTVTLENWRTSEARGRRVVEEATIRIRNREDYAVRVDKVRFRHPRTPFAPHVPVVVDGGEVPFDVPAREVVTLTIRPEQGFRFPRPTERPAFVPGVSLVLRTGEQYKSWHMGWRVAWR